MLFLEGAISENPWGGTTFTRIKAPSHSDMVELVHTISQRIAKYLEKVGLVERDMENSFLNLPVDDKNSLLQLQGASVAYRIAIGPQLAQCRSSAQCQLQTFTNIHLNWCFGQLRDCQIFLHLCSCVDTY
jgi:hypothetical protein